MQISIIYLLRGGSLASANSPDRLISKHDLAPVLYVVCKDGPDKMSVF